MELLAACLYFLWSRNMKNTLVLLILYFLLYYTCSAFEINIDIFISWLYWPLYV